MSLGFDVKNQLPYGVIRLVFRLGRDVDTPLFTSERYTPRFDTDTPLHPALTPLDPVIIPGIAPQFYVFQSTSAGLPTER